MKRMMIFCGMMMFACAAMMGCRKMSEQTPDSVIESPEYLEDGTYTIHIRAEGGSGRAAITSPSTLRVENGQMFVTIVWSSPYYDYMKIGEDRYDPVNTEGNSVFELPVADLGSPLSVIADTVAMSEPHEIEYTLYLNMDHSGEAETEARSENHVGVQTGAVDESRQWDEMTVLDQMELLYADQFSVDYYEDDYALINIADVGRYLVVPEDMAAPAGLDSDITVLQKPLDNIYLVATSAMDLFRQLDGIGNIRLVGTDAEGWYIEEARQAIEQGDMLYAGKYSTPDYELILSQDCDLAVESTMIMHSPEVREQLERLGVPVLVERSSYENHPLGRVEWLKLYSVLLDKEDEAAEYMKQQSDLFEAMEDMENTGKTVAFFYINSTGAVNVRKSNDYVAQAIEFAGGKYIFDHLEGEDDNALATMNMQMETFYDQALDADFLIYSSSIGGEIQTIDELLAKSSLLADFKAVKEGHVLCTKQSMFQESTGICAFMDDIAALVRGEDRPLTYLRYLED